MSKIGEKIYDLTPAWLCRLVCWIKERPRYIRWWFSRAQGKLPACDCWEFNDTLAKTIIQGLDYLLNGCTDWECESQRQQKEDMIYIKGVMQSFLELHSTFWNPTKEEYEQHQKSLEKAFQLLGKYMWGLWD